MSRWMIEKSGTGIEKSGTGIEKSGTGIEKSGTGIEKSGTGIEKSGTGIEKSGTGIRQAFFLVLITAIAFASQVSASNAVNPTGTLSIVVDKERVAVSWIIGGSVFSGVSSLYGSQANLLLTEVSVRSEENSELKVVGGGTGAKVVGGGTGVSVVGGGTGADVVGGGTGVSVVGGGTGVSVVGGGTGVSVVGGGTGADVVGGGTGVSVVGGGTGADVVGGGTGQLIVGGGTGSDALIITLPDGTDMQMEISLGCNSANVSILDSNSVEVVSFSDVPVIGASAYCADFDGSDGYDFDKQPRGNYYEEK